MKKTLMISWILILIILTVAVFTKPSYDDTFFRISKELNSRGYQAGLFYNYDKVGHTTSKNPSSTIVIKDRLFYRDIYFPINGKVQRIAIAAFTRLFLIN
ncbi:MAG: hypothetical protein ABUT20_19185 [Bacteroidota bacterium]